MTITDDTAPVNPYAAPRADISSGGASDERELLTRDETLAYADGNGEYYWARWERALRRGRFLAGFNFAAFFFNMNWLLYRKLYREFCVCLGMQLVGYALLAFVGVPERDELIVRPLMRLAMGVTVGVLGNGLYLRRARITAERARMPHDARAHLPLLAKLGGTSMLGPILYIVANAIVFIAMRAAANR